MSFTSLRLPDALESVFTSRGCDRGVVIGFFRRVAAGRCGAVTIWYINSVGSEYQDLKSQGAGALLNSNTPHKNRLGPDRAKSTKLCYLFRYTFCAYLVTTNAGFPDNLVSARVFWGVFKMHLPGLRKKRSMRPLASDPTMRRLIRQARPYWSHLAGVLILSLAAAPLTLALPLPLKIAVDNVISSQPPPRFLTWVLPAGSASSAAGMLAIAAGMLVLTTLLLYLQSLSASILQTYTGEKLTLDFRAVLFQHVQQLSLSYHDTRGSTDSNYRIQYDAPCIQNILVTGGLPLLTAAVTLIGMLSVTMLVDWKIASVALTLCPVLFILTYKYGARLRLKWHEIKGHESSAMSIVQEALGAVRVVKAFGREGHEQERFVRLSEKRLRTKLRTAYLEGRFDLAVGMTIAVGTAATLVIGVGHVQAGTLTVGSLLLLMTYVAQMYEPLKTVSKKVGDLQSSVVSAERAFALLDEVPEVVEHPQARPVSRAAGAVEFRRVSFAYPQSKDVLRNISLVANPGTRVGIAGRTGAGKSTLINLLMRFYDPSIGEILLDGVPLPEYKLADLRKQFGMVLQDPVLFSATVRENIAYANPRATDEEIVRSAKLANAHDFITALPDGYQTEVGERGMRLSGGERQRISLARAFLKDAPMLILDEPTSAVDIKTEGAIMDAMERLMHGRTTFMIAHRLSTLEKSDVRIELVGGRIAGLSRPGQARRVEDLPAVARLAVHL